MKEKIWALLVDSILEQCRGAGYIMDNTIKVSRECYCELSGCDEEWLIEQINGCRKEAFALLDDYCTNTGAVLEFFEYKLGKLKESMEGAQ